MDTISRRISSVLAVAALSLAALGATVTMAPSASALSNTVYVAAVGSDAGNDCAVQASPCATINYAQTHIPASGTIKVSGTLIENVVLTKAATIDGLGAAAPAVIDGGAAGRVVTAFDGYLIIRGVTVTNGYVDGRGGGIAADGLTVDRVAVSNNVATMDGGGIVSYGGLNLMDSLVSNNTTGNDNIAIRGGGGISMIRGSDVTITRSRVTGNSTGFGNGGGLEVSDLDGGSATIIDSTFDNNSSGNYGSAIGVPNNGLVVRNSTFAGNAADFGAIYLYGSGNAWITGSTVTGSDHALFQQGGGFGGTVHVGGSVFDNTSDECTFGAGTFGVGFASAGYNVFGDGNCVNTVATDVIAASNLGALTNNGGPTPTRLPNVGSPAIGLVPSGTSANGSSLCPRDDQRGVAGPPSGQSACSAGAVEAVAGVAPVFTSAAGTSAATTTALSFSVTTTGPTPLLSVSPGSSLPAGVTFTDNRDGTGTIGGTAPAPGSYLFTLVANNGIGGDVTQAFTLTVTKLAQAALTVTSTSGTVGTPLTLTYGGGSGSGLVTYGVSNGTATGCAIVSDALIAATAGTCDVSAQKAGDATYLPISSTPTTVTLAKASQAPLTVTSVSGTIGTPLTLTYDGGSGSGSVTFEVADDTATGCAIESGALSAATAGTCTVTATKAGDSVYLPTSSDPTTVTLTTAVQDALTVTSTSGTYGTPLTLTTTGGSGSGEVSFEVSDDTATGCAVSPTEPFMLSVTGAGTCTLTATKAGDGVYDPVSSDPTTVSFDKAAQEIVFITIAPGGATVGDGTYSVIAFGGDSGNPVVLTLDASSTGCTLDGSVVAFSGAGTCVINADQDGDVNYYAAPQAQQSFVIAQASQAISFTSSAPVDATAGGDGYTVSADGGASTQPVVFSLDPTSTGCELSGATVSFTAVGTCVINANQDGDDNYTAAPQVQQSIAVGQGSQAVNFTSTVPASAAVGDSAYTVTATGGGSTQPVVLSLDATSTGCELSGATVTFPAVGTCVINANQAGDANYTASPQVQQTFAVGQGAQAISYTSTPPAGVVVGDSAYEVSADGGGSGNAVVFSLDATSTGCELTGATVTFPGAGTCVINANQAGDANYTAAPQVQQSFAVGKAVQAIVFTSTAPTDAIAGGATYGVSATGGASGNPVTFSLSPSSTGCFLTGSTVTFIAGGTCVVLADQAGNTNYLAAPTVQQSIAVTPVAGTTETTTTLRVGTIKGNQVRFTVKVAPRLPKKVVPNGQVLVQVGSNKVCLIVLNKGGGSCTVPASTFPSATYQVRAYYIGNSTFAPSEVTIAQHLP